MSSLRRIGPPREGRGSLSLVAYAGSYAVRIGGRWYPWDRVRAALRQALEADLPPQRRSQEAKDLAAFLWGPPTRVGYILARPRLLRIWEELHGEARV